jgi:hypothetical protein
MRPRPGRQLGPGWCPVSGPGPGGGTSSGRQSRWISLLLLAVEPVHRHGAVFARADHLVESAGFGPQRCRVVGAGHGFARFMDQIGWAISLAPQPGATERADRRSRLVQTATQTPTTSSAKLAQPGSAAASLHQWPHQPGAAMVLRRMWSSVLAPWRGNQRRQMVDGRWHVDPTSRHQYRYSDGRTWRRHVVDNGAFNIASRIKTMPRSAEDRKTMRNLTAAEPVAGAESPTHGVAPIAPCLPPGRHHIRSCR